jgi:hypothetical protein
MKKILAISVLVTIAILFLLGFGFMFYMAGGWMAAAGFYGLLCVIISVGFTRAIETLNDE